MKIKWELIKERKYKAGFRNMLKRTYELPDGTKSAYDIVDYAHSVGILPLTEDNKIIMVKMFRPGPNKILMEIPGGFIDSGESTKTAAERELLEETGYSGDLELMGKGYDSAYSTEYKYHFLARNAKKVAKQKLEGEEFIELVELSLEEFKDHVESGELTDPEAGQMALRVLGL